MIKTFTFPTLILLLLTFDVFGKTGNLVVTPKKINYTRKGVRTDQKTVVVRYPVVSGTMQPAIKRKIENSISYWSNFGRTLKESLSDTWLDSLDYKINYNKNGIFDISLIMEGAAAYPDTSIKNLVIDLKNGEPVKFSDVFKTETLNKLAVIVDKKLQSEKNETLQQIENDVKAGNETADTGKALKERIESLKFTVENFNEFSVGDKGVTILYDAEFPHVIQALEPVGRYFFSYNELKPFIKTNSILGQFVR